MGVFETLIPGLFGLGGVVLGGWLSSIRSNSEKLIDLRRKTYGSILSELWEVERLCDIASEYISEVGEENYFHSEPTRKHDREVYDRMSRVRQNVMADYLIISDEFRNIYEAMNKEAAEDDRDVLPPDAHTIFDARIRKFRPMLLARARIETDTTVSSKWWPANWRTK